MPDDDPETTERPEGQSADPPPGPADHGGQGGMATREKAPELAKGDDSRY